MCKTIPFISLIVPVYNVEKYLHHCIDSILSQTFSNFELLLVDDGSTDSSGKICNEFQNKDSRIHVIHKKNSGVSETRNIGIAQANGEWICFIDSDDWIEPIYLGNFTNCIRENKDSDLCVQGFYSDYEDSKKVDAISFPRIVFDNNFETIEYFEKTNGVHNGYIWHRIFRADIIREKHLKFKPGVSFAEDGLFFFQYMYYVRKTAFTEKMGYHHLRRRDSLTLAGRRLDIYLLIPVFCAYIETLMSYSITDIERKESFNSFVRMYGCRLMQNWLIQKVVANSRNESSTMLNKLKEISTKFHLGEAKTIDLSMKLLLSSLNIRNSYLRHHIVVGLYYYRIYKNKIFSKLK